MIVVIAEHSVSIDLLPEGAKVLDLGCRGFQFTDHMRSLGHNVYAVDIDYFDRDDYAQVAISDQIGRSGIRRTPDPQATSICIGNEVQCMTLELFSLSNGVEMWDLIKMDIERSEFDVIMSMDRAYTKQLSVEFHMHCGQTDYQITSMVSKLESLGYKTIQHEKTARHGLKPNYWDSLFILE